MKTKLLGSPVWYLIYDCLDSALFREEVSICGLHHLWIAEVDGQEVPFLLGFLCHCSPFWGWVWWLRLVRITLPHPHPQCHFSSSLLKWQPVWTSCLPRKELSTSSCPLKRQNPPNCCLPKRQTLQQFYTRGLWLRICPLAGSPHLPATTGLPGDSQ